MPMLAPTKTCCPPSITGREITSMALRATLTMSEVVSTSSRITVNSSPPMRATESLLRMQ